jgi:hypothetical protein
VRVSGSSESVYVCLFSSGVLSLSYLCDIFSIEREVLGCFDALGLFSGRQA